MLILRVVFTNPKPGVSPEEESVTSASRTRVVGAKILGRSCSIRAVERVVPEHFNPARGLYIPRSWQIEVTDGLPCDLQESPFMAVAASSKEAEKGLLGDLRAAGVSGVVTIKREAA